MTSMQKLYLLVPLAPLAGAILAGLGGRVLGRAGSHTVTIFGVLVATIASALVFVDVVYRGNTFNGNVYTWSTVGDLTLAVGFLIDPLTALMMLVVSFVSLMVHVYTIGYMADDPGYQRFFSYISLFTFSMLMLVMSNNFLQLFFGWEAVGLVSYLLIGFWYKRPTAIHANLKAFLVNRVGDFGFILGIGLVFAYFGTLDYAAVFKAAPGFVARGQTLPGTDWALITVICICLFIGAMGKSAQFPLHVWLPDSMEGPTPISALIHAATMVTAGIFMVARMSPLFELSEAALSLVIVIGAITALFMGFLGIVQNDIKRVVAYSTLSQLGYMTVALGASAYSVAIFHLMTHAFFKALLFLAAGSVIIGLHHDQDLRNMGGLRKYMPVTWITSLIGSLALIGTPFFSGFYSKDSILIATGASNVPGSGFAYFAVTVGVFVTAFYSFRMYFLAFHGKERFGQAHDEDHEDEEPTGDHHHGLAAGEKPHESPAVVTIPLILLAIPSVVIGFVAVDKLLFGDFFRDAIFVDAKAHPSMGVLREHFHGATAMALHGFVTLPFFLALAGVLLAWFFYLKRPDIPEMLAQRFSALYALLVNKYYMDRFNEIVFAGGARAIGRGLWKGGDVALIDGAAVNGSARLVGWFAGVIRFVQSGYIYHYAFAMLIGIAIVLFFFLTLPYVWPALTAR
ncbi:NADH-quinone oxidoreductase subunit L [Betaproteobacteria bacterium PRO7]|jgi:NADH-quinone oxidoreductase subunit L|nr:NADH-quinone oxidoreductase subunit L [Betaproteobacteria bacterium PRO7]GIL04251.1 MAG: NADH dehydrogenase subunit L [Betaproteobacteria bacterium]